MRSLIAFIAAFSLCFSQTVEIRIPGERVQQPQPQPQAPANGSGGSSLGLGAIIMGVLGAALFSAIFSSAFGSQGKVDTQRDSKGRTLPLFVPFEFIVVHVGMLEGVNVLETVNFEDITFSLVRWEDSQEALERALGKSAVFVQPNYIYQTFGLAQGVKGEVSSSRPKGAVCLLDTGVDKQVLGERLLGIRDHIGKDYVPEDHGTASAFLIAKEGASVFAHRVCSEGRCTSMAFAKGLIGCLKDGVRVFNTPFGMYGEDRLIEIIIGRLVASGYKIVAPVGNREGRVAFPASLKGVLRVAGEPCFPRGLCEDAIREPYRVRALGVGAREAVFVGTSFSSAIHAGKIATSP